MQDFADALLAIADPCYKAAGQKIKADLDAAFAKTTDAFKKCVPSLLFPLRPPAR